VKGQYKTIIGTAHQCLRTTPFRFGVVFRKNSIKLCVERDWGKKLTAEEEKLLKQLNSRTRLKNLCEVKLLELSIRPSPVLSFGERADALPSLSPLSGHQCGCLPPPSPCFASFFTSPVLVPSL